MSWLLIALTVWAAAAVAVALVIGRSIRLADNTESMRTFPQVPDFLPGDWAIPASTTR